MSFARCDLVGWQGALHAIGQIAAAAAIESGTNDPYQCQTFFGPQRWGKSRSYELPTEAVSERTVLPVSATLALIEPDVRPLDLSRGELIHEAEAAIDAGITSEPETTPVPTSDSGGCETESGRSVLGTQVSESCITGLGDLCAEGRRAVLAGTARVAGWRRVEQSRAVVADDGTVESPESSSLNPRG